MKCITKREMEKLLKHGVIKHSKYGIVNEQGTPTGFYKTRTHRYIEDKYVDIARKLD